MAVTYNLKGTTNSSFKVDKAGNGTVQLGAIDASGNTGSVASITGHLVPSANITYDLGTSSLMWRDIYVGPGSIYVNGKKVIEDNSGTITVSTDADQNLAIATSGTGQTTIQSAAGLNLTTTGTADITFTTSTGQVNFDGDVIVNAAKSISSSNSDPITFADPISVSGNSTMANLTISGNLTVQGTTTTIDSTTVQIQNAFKFEGATADDFETTLTVVDPTADRTITLPDATGTVVLADANQTLTNKTLGATTISGHLTPSANVTYDLGTSAYRFRDIYLSGTTIDLGGAKLTNDGSDNLDIKDSSGNRKIIRASAIELVDSNGKKMKLERDATSGKLKQTRKNSDGTDEGSSDTLDIVGDTSPQLGGDLDTNGNNITFGDNDTAYFGTGNDLSIYHDGSHSYIKDVGTGNLWIGSNGEYTALGNSTASEFYIKASNNGAVELYYDNSKKLETTTSGATVTGTLVADGLTVDTNTLYVDATNNRVGIGTTSPDELVHISTGTGLTRAVLKLSAASDQYLTLRSIHNGTTSEIISGYGLDLIANGSNDLRFYTNSSLRMVVNGNGNVGIGTASPTEELDVTGDGKFSGNVTVTGNLTVNGTTTTVNSTQVNVQNAFVFEGTTADDYETTLTVTDPTADRTITLPDATGTVALTSDLTSYITASSTDTLTNKTISLTNNTLSGTTAEFNSALSDGSFATLAGTETLSNKTLTSPTISGTVPGVVQIVADSSSNGLFIKGRSSDNIGTMKFTTNDGNTGLLELSARSTVSIINAVNGDLSVRVNSSEVLGHNGTTFDVVGNQTLTGNLTFEGATNDAFETTLTVTDPTADRTITLPDATGTVVLQDSTDTLSNKTLASPTVTGNVAFDTDVLFVDATNNRVGVNTSSPADPFVVKQGTGETRFGGTNGRTLSAYDNGTLNNFDFKANQVYFEADLLVNGAKKISTHNGSTQNLYITTSDATKAIYTDRDIITDGDLIFEGATANDYETTLTVTDPTADRTITLPDATGTLLLDSSTFGYPKDFGSITGSTSTFPVGTAPDFGALTGDDLIGQDFGIIDSYISLTALKTVVSASTDFADFKTRIAGL